MHIPPHLLPVLAAHLLEHVPPACELVFPNDHGEPLHRGSFTTVWHRATAPACPASTSTTSGTPAHRPRRTTGASTRELMARMGHASMRAAVLYQHATSERDREIAVALSELALQRRPPSSSVVRLFPAAGDHDDHGDGTGVQ